MQKLEFVSIFRHQDTVNNCTHSHNNNTIARTTTMTRHSQLHAIETWESLDCNKQYGKWIWVRNYLEFKLPNNDFLSGGLKTTLSFPGTIRPSPLVFSGSNIIVVLSKSIGPPLPPCFWKMQKSKRMFLVKHLFQINCKKKKLELKFF